MNHKHHGFTLIELMIVMVVVAILAAVTVVAYTTMTRTARDTARRASAAQVAEALKLMAAGKTLPAIGGADATVGLGPDKRCPNGDVGGWVFVNGTGGEAIARAEGAYQCTVGDMAMAGGYLPDDMAGRLTPPEGAATERRYAGLWLAPCTPGPRQGPAKYLLFYHVAVANADDQASLDSRRTFCGGHEGLSNADLASRQLRGVRALTF